MSVYSDLAWSAALTELEDKVDHLEEELKEALSLVSGLTDENLDQAKEIESMDYAVREAISDLAALTRVPVAMIDPCIAAIRERLESVR